MMTFVVGCTPGTLAGPELETEVTSFEDMNKGGADHNTEDEDTTQNTGKGGGGADHNPEG
jgi:hypothetical protein